MEIPPSPARRLGPRRDWGSGDPGGLGLLGFPGRGQAARGARGAGAGPRGVGLSSSPVLTGLRRIVGVPRLQSPPHGIARASPSGASCCISQATLGGKDVYFESPSSPAETPTPWRIARFPWKKFCRFHSLGNLEPSTRLCRTWLLLFILKSSLGLSRSKCYLSPSCA